MENFAAQDAEYRDAVLPPPVRARVVARGGQPRSAGTAGSASAARRSGWRRSARPLRRATLYKHFGFTPERVAEAGRGRQARALERSRLDEGTNMSTVTELNPRLLAITEAGVSVWLDQIRRSMVQGRRARADGRGESRCAASPRTRRSSRRRSSARPTTTRTCATLAREDLDALAIYEHIAIRDVQLAADVLAGVHRESDGRDGFVSLEVAPELAHDTEGTLEQARSYWQRARPPERDDQDPGDAGGRARDRAGDLRGDQRQRHAAVRASPRTRRSPRPTSAALERRHAEGLPLNVNSVARFFVSRVDTNVDRALEQLGRDRSRRDGGARQRARGVPRGSRRSSRASAGTRCGGRARAVQRPLWASTGHQEPRTTRTRCTSTG